MDTITEVGSKSLASIPPEGRNNPANNLRLKQLRYRELDAEFRRQNQRLARMMKQLKKSLNKKIG